MKDIMVFIVAVFAMILGFRFMRHVDIILKQINHDKQELDDIQDKKILLFPVLDNKKYTDIVGILNQLKVTYKTLEGTDIVGLKNYDYIMALSDNDLDNLILCKEAKQYLDQAYTVALCNNKKYEIMFRNEDIDTIVFDYDTIKKLLQEQVVIR